jgi:ATP-dependent protease Clp ATPase subunit
MESVMTKIMYAIPSDLSIKKVIITADAVRGGEPTILRDATNPRPKVGAGK